MIFISYQNQQKLLSKEEKQYQIKELPLLIEV